VRHRPIVGSEKGNLKVLKWVVRACPNMVAMRQIEAEKLDDVSETGSAARVHLI
jgi:hypothetical protein